jgi:flavin reductase (DIM6/NTAB) family NADH-FMN oxidoreductase RutF
LIPGGLAAIECETAQRITAGDHDIFVGRMVAAETAEGSPLLYFAGGYRAIASE